MKANELRIGNLVSQYYSFGVPVPYWRNWEITIGDDINHVMGNPDKYKGIQLTEEWLERFGFENQSKALKTPDKTLNVSAIVDGYYYMYLDDVFGSIFDLERIQYVHQLQNLYFALTGQELSVT